MAPLSIASPLEAESQEFAETAAVWPKATERLWSSESRGGRGLLHVAVQTPMGKMEGERGSKCVLSTQLDVNGLTA